MMGVSSDFLADSTGPAARPQLRHVLVVESLPLFADGVIRILRSLADVQALSVSLTFSGIKGLLRGMKPELVLLDGDAGDGGPIDAARIVRRHAETAKLLFLKADFCAGFLADALRAGACGVVLKSLGHAAMRVALSRAISGEAVIPVSTAPRDVGSKSRTDSDRGRSRPLSRRESQVLRCVALGLSVKSTAKALNVSPKTIESHRTRLMAKLGIHDRVLLAHFALQSGQCSSAAALGGAKDMGDASPVLLLQN
jgi:DNA-binding NarL/FixJ family response regulator